MSGCFRVLRMDVCPGLWISSPGCVRGYPEMSTTSKEQGMERFEELRITAIEQNLTGDFPSWLLEEVLAIADAPKRYGDSASLVETLIAQIREYDPFSGMGCFNAPSVGIETIRSTIREIRLRSN
jgi:hypothetical protein